MGATGGSVREQEDYGPKHRGRLRSYRSVRVRWRLHEPRTIPFPSWAVGGRSLRPVGQADRWLVRVKGEGNGFGLVECGRKHWVNNRHLGLASARFCLRLAKFNHHTGDSRRRVGRFDLPLLEGRGEVEWSLAARCLHSAEDEELLGTRHGPVHPPRELLHLPRLATPDAKGGLWFRRPSRGHSYESVQPRWDGVEPGWRRDD